MSLKNIFISIILLIFISCNSISESKIITGDLNYSWLRVQNFYGIPDSIVNYTTIVLDTIVPRTYEDSLYYNVYKKLKKEKLLFNPYILITSIDSIQNTIYLDNFTYNKIKIYKSKDLHENDQKIELKFLVEEIEKGFYISKEMISLNKVKGITKPRPNKKFGAVDYK